MVSQRSDSSQLLEFLKKMAMLKLLQIQRRLRGAVETGLVASLVLSTFT
jgi:hypothetical protein